MTLMTTVDRTANRTNRTRRGPKRKNGGTRGLGISVVLSILVLAFLAIAAAFPEFLTSRDPYETNLAHAVLPPSSEYIMGTDKLGRDIYTRLVYGARESLSFGVIATVIAVAIGSLVGLISGLAHRFLDAVIMRVLEVVLAFPELLLALVIIAILGPGTQNMIIALAVSATPTYARMVRIATMQAKRSGYVEAAVALGQPRWRIITFTVLPNVISSLLVLATIGLGGAIMAGASLSFLGLGPVHPSPEWGLALSEGRSSLAAAWWVAVFPGLAITSTVISTTYLGRHLQRRFEGRA